MYEKPFTLQIITPAGVAYQGEVVSVSAPGVLGGFQILYNHAPMLSALETGEVKAMDKQSQGTRYAIGGGFLEVKGNAVVVLADTVERASEIDVERAVRAKERATHRLHSKDPGMDVERARLAMIRALNRLRVAAKTDNDN